MAKKQRLRKRDVLVYALVFVLVLVAVIAIAEIIEHLPSRTPAYDDADDRSDVQNPYSSGSELSLGEDIAPEGARATPGTSLNIDGKYDVNIKNIVLIGVDKEELGESMWYRTGGQSDVIMILSMNMKTKEYFILDINRDLAVPVQNYDFYGASYGYVDEQIALAYAYGDGSRESGRNVMKSLHALLGEDIPFLGYIAAPIPIIRALADAVGGVEVKIENDFTGVDDTLIMGEIVNLTGIHAENFVRARMHMTDDTHNTARMGRQIQFLEAFIKKAKSTMSAKQVVDLYEDVLDMTMTDMGKSDITKWILTAYDYDYKGVTRIDGEEGERLHDARCHYYDPEEVAEIVKELYYK